MSINDYNYTSKSQEDSSPGPFLAKVVGHMDSTFMGILEVEILRPSGNLTTETELRQVKYLSPFYGVTSALHLGNIDDYNNTQKSYGMWMVPPDVGTIVMVIFIDGDPRKGYWMGCVMDEGMNFMMPGLAATQKVVEDPDPDKAGKYGRVPTAEFNKKVKNTDDPDASQAYKPMHPFTKVLQSQGLVFDDIRGITTSSARREVPSMVFGISTPGPRDKQSNAQRGRIGKDEWKLDDAFVSRLGGTTFVMDDGDDRFIRKTSASEGPPEYSSVENGETDGDKTIPHNELFRIRTRTGHQILLHNSEDLIYITNARGTAWVELSSDGKIDIYSKDSISVRTENDLNFFADRDINMEAKRNINLKSGAIFHAEAGSDYNIIAKANGLITVGGQSNISAGGNHVETAAQIHMNGPAAKKAKVLSTFENPTEKEGATLESIMLRVPTTEPYPHHENLDPASFKTTKTDRETGSAIAVPDGWQKYTTSVDTFQRIPPPATSQEQEESGT